MDSVSIAAVVKQFKELKFVFGGVWSADNFPKVDKKAVVFQIINTSKSKTRGTHWILLLAFPEYYKFPAAANNK